MTEELTAEEKQAYEEMQAAPAVEDTSPVEAPEQPAQEPQEAISKPAEGEPEFTSQRAQEKPPEGYVPHQAMHAERAKRKELEKKLAEIEARLAEKEKPADPEPQFVDPLEDPDGFRKYTEHQEKRRQEAIDQFLKQNKAEREREALVQEAGRLEQEFMAKTPDYMDAVQPKAAERQMAASM